MKLLIEASHEVEVLHEATDSGKKMFIEGIFAQAEVKNGNGRWYSKGILEAAVDAYNTNFVSRRRALGELNHPDRPFADPANAAILIESLTWDGNNVIGKARVLPTPQGQIVSGLLEGGFNMGVSTRGLGSLKESGGMKHVQSDLMLTAIDAVDNPSAPNAYVRQLFESSWMVRNGVWVPINEEIDQGPQVNEQMFLDQLDTLIKGLRR